MYLAFFFFRKTYYGVNRLNIFYILLHETAYLSTDGVCTATSTHVITNTSDVVADRVYINTGGKQTRKHEKDIHRSKRIDI